MPGTRDRVLRGSNSGGIDEVGATRDGVWRKISGRSGLSGSVHVGVRSDLENGLQRVEGCPVVASRGRCVVPSGKRDQLEILLIDQEPLMPHQHFEPRIEVAVDASLHHQTGLAPECVVDRCDSRSGTCDLYKERRTLGFEVGGVRAFRSATRCRAAAVERLVTRQRTARCRSPWQRHRGAWCE